MEVRPVLRRVLPTLESVSEIEEPQPARPWRPEDGPRPQVWTWPNNARPALAVWSAGRWRYASVRARQVWGDGSVYYQVLVDLHGDTRVTTRLYRWPQPGLRVAHRSPVKPSQGPDERWQGGLPRAPHGRARTGPQDRSATGT